MDKICRYCRTVIVEKATQCNCCYAPIQGVEWIDNKAKMVAQSDPGRIATINGHSNTMAKIEGMMNMIQWGGLCANDASDILAAAMKRNCELSI